MDEKSFACYRREFKVLEKTIREYDRIVIYRHVSPDFDALGSQMGLYTWIKDNFPNKEVHYVGDNHESMMPSLYPFPEKLSEDWYKLEHLAITVDVPDRKRIADNHIQMAKFVLKLDHHPLPKEEDGFGDYRIVHPDRPAASEILALFILSRSAKYKKSKAMADYLYGGIVGDTGRFLYQDTDGATLRVAASLLDLGADKEKIYHTMYQTDKRKMDILRFCLDTYKITDKGTCYFVFTKEDLKKLDMVPGEGNLHMNLFRNMKEVRSVVSITEDPEKEEFRVSLRSEQVHVAPAALLFGGGGHDFAAGCRIKTLDELPALLEACDNLE
jgi:phosphoesterase RecJ-like protein